MWNAGLDKSQAGIKIARRNSNSLRYADTTILMAESEEELKSLLMKVKEDSENAGLKLDMQNSRSHYCCSVTRSYLTLWPHGLQHPRPPCPSSPSICSNSCSLSQWRHPTISSSVLPFSSCLQSFPASGSFPVSWLFAPGGLTIGASALAWVLPINSQGWSPLGWTGWISLQSKGLSRVFSNTTVQKHQFFGAQLSLWSSSHIHTRLLEKP